MNASPAQRSGESSEVIMKGVDRAGSSDLKGSVSSLGDMPSPIFGDVNQAAGFTSDTAAQAGIVPPQSTPDAHHPFNLDSFDFGADFGLPNSLDELTLFHHHQQQQQQQQQQQHHHHQIQQQQQRSQSQHRRNGSTGGRSIGGPASSDGLAGSPRNVGFSPGSSLRDHQRLQSGGASRTQSPHSLSVHGDGSTAGPGKLSDNSISNSELQNLLMAVQNSTAMAPQHSQQQQQHHQTTLSAALNNSEAMGTQSMSLSELEKYLAEKEQTEKLQIMQTAFLRQQLESLQRQQEQSTSQHMDPARPFATSQGNLTAAHLMQQFNQMTPQHSASTPTQQNPHYPLYRSQSFADSMSTSAPHPSQSFKANVSAMTQYGLVTPLSSGAFAQPGAQAFVSPIHMPSSSTNALIETQRAYDASMASGTFTPLESPAITPASVFSNVGTGNSMTNQDVFSPLTSPALRPHVGHTAEDMMLPPASPYHGPVMARSRTRGGSKASPHSTATGRRTTTPSASPVTAPTKSVPRKNRSTTAEARANRARPSPLVKPTVSTSTKKKSEASSIMSGLPSPLGTSYTNGGASNRNSSFSEDGQKASQTAFPPLTAGEGMTKPMDASPSEEAASTPSPIDLNMSAATSATGKPMTPGSVMGIGAKKGKTRSVDSAGKQVSFASHSEEQQELQANESTDSLRTILPDGPSSKEGDSWTTQRASGGLESRRTSHKAAEQKRRDSLKYCFDELRGMLPAITLDDDVPGGSSLGPDGFLEDQEQEGFSIEEVGDAESARIANRAISKVALLRHSNEYLIRLKHRLARRDQDLDYCRKQILELRSRLGFPVESQLGGVMVAFTSLNPDVANRNRIDQAFGVPPAMNQMDIS